MAAVFYYRYGNAEIAKRLENALIQRSVPGGLIQTAELYHFDKRQVPIREWLEDSSHVEKQICIAITLAASNPTLDEVATAHAIVRQVLDTNPVAAWYVILRDVAYLLGDDKLANEIIGLAKKSGKLDDDWRWWRWTLEFYDGDISPEKLIEKAEPFQGSMASAHYAIAMKALGKREIEVAKKSFLQAIKSAKVTTYPYHSSKAFLLKMDRETKRDRETWLRVRPK